MNNERLMSVGMFQNLLERSKFKVLNDQSSICFMQIEDFSPFADFSQSIFSKLFKFSH